MNFRRPLVCAALTGLIVSLGGNILAWRTIHELQTREWALRRQPIARGPWPTTGDAGQPTVLLLGDSRMKLWPAFSVPGHRVVNAGVGGETTAQILARLDTVLAETQPTTVVLQAGINDLRTFAFFPDEQQAIEATCLANLRILVQRCRASGARVVVSPIWPTADVPLWRLSTWSEAIPAARERINAALVAELPPDVPVWSPALQSDDFRDTFHLKRAAYEPLTRQLTALLAPEPAQAVK